MANTHEEDIEELKLLFTLCPAMVDVYAGSFFIMFDQKQFPKHQRFFDNSCFEEKYLTASPSKYNFRMFQIFCDKFIPKHAVAFVDSRPDLKISDFSSYPILLCWEWNLLYQCQ